MFKHSIDVSPADRIGITYSFQLGTASVVNLRFSARTPRNVAVVSVGSRSIELTRGGRELQCCCAYESGKRRALMLVYPPLRDGKVFGVGETSYLVDVGEAPGSGIIFTRQGSRPSVVVTRRRIDLPERIQSEVRQGKFSTDFVTRRASPSDATDTSTFLTSSIIACIGCWFRRKSEDAGEFDYEALIGA